MRRNLKEARKKAGLTQQQVANAAGIGLRYYKAIESGERLGGVPVWDRLEELFMIQQKILRENETLSNDHAREENL